METIAIVGVGLIGASFGLALRKAGFTGEIIGVSSSGAIAGGLQCGAISCAASLEEAVAEADLVYLAQPVNRILETIPKIAPHLKNGALVTDAGSTKQAIVACGNAHLPAGSFLGGHPIAGKEQRGASAADGELFRNRPYVLTPAQVKDEHLKIQRFRSTISALGAKVIEMTPKEHDHTLALTSHLPQLLSTALAATLAETGDKRLAEVFGTGLLDMTRLAMSSAELWSSILQTNEAQVAAGVDALVRVLLELKSSIGERELVHTFDKASAFSKSLRQTN